MCAKKSTSANNLVIQSTYPTLASAIAFQQEEMGQKVIVKFARSRTEHLIKGNKKKLRELGQRVVNNDEMTPLRGKVIYYVRQKEEAARVSSVYEKIIVYLKSSDKLEFTNLFKL